MPPAQSAAITAGDGTALGSHDPCWRHGPYGPRDGWERLRKFGEDVFHRLFSSHGLADPTRVRILLFLLTGPRTTGEIVHHIGRHQPSVSTHLTCLRFCGYVEARRIGRNVAERIMACRVIAPADRA
jgi:hypothetical protein